MKHLLLLFAILFLFNCSSDNEPEANNNLILNSTFENSNEFDFQNWTGRNYASNDDTPVNGGNFSLQLEPNWAPDEGFAETVIANLEGAVSLNFDCDTKTINWIGKIIILKEDIDGTRTEISNISFDNSDWQNVSFDINTNLVSTDLLIIHLSAGITEIATGKVLFDNIRITN